MATSAPLGDLAPREELGPAVEVLARLARILERASGDLSLAHYRVLAMVSAGDGRASRLATRLALGKPAISAAVESLAGHELIVRSGSEEDHRATHLQITPRGRLALAAAESAMAAELADLLRRTPDPDAVLSALQALCAGLDRRLAERAATATAPAAITSMSS
jgi:DNA-binding MarR family transcriptional regulator